jgi:ABC-type Zn2+ transport system substrate-binding protein/surface adhesin
MSLEVPGMDIVGFEHAAERAEQKAAVEKGTATLSAPLTLFKIPASAGCKVTDAKVVIEAEHEEGEEDHDAKEGADHAKDGHDAKGDHDHDEHAGHNQFHATYALECGKPAEITSIAFDYFKSFAGAQELTVNVVTAKAQNKYEVTRDKPTLDLGGMM